MGNYVADFETYVPDSKTLDKLDRKKYPKNYLTQSEIETYVWGWGLVEVGKFSDDDIILGNNIESFIEQCFRLKNPTIYFHNLKFDGMFILDWALKNGYTYSDKKESMTINTIISKTNIFYKIELIKHRRKKGYTKLTFYDSLKKLPFSVDGIGKGFNLDFNKVDVEEDFYLKYRSKNHELTEEEKEYIRNDIRVVSQALQIQFNQGLTKMTNGSDALNEFKLLTGKKQFERLFPVLDLDTNAQILLAYRGGWTYASENYIGKEVGKGLVYDVNSLYPSVMYNKKMPYGKPLFFKGKYVDDSLYDLYIQEFECEFRLKENHVPTIQIKNSMGRYNPREYLHESKGLTKLHLTNIDLNLFFDHYEVWNISYNCGWKFRSGYNLFKNYIDKWNAIKITNDGAIRQLAKLMLNSLYGKFGTKPDVTGKKVILDENGVVKLELKEEELREPVYTAIAVWTTSYARDVTIRTAQQVYPRFMYADTDSIHIIGTEVPNIDIDSREIGKWKLEGEFSWAKYLGAKCYVEEFDGNLSVVVAGMPKNQKEHVTKENFNIGLILDGKKVPTTVNGGIVLVDRTFEVKIKNFY